MPWQCEPRVCAVAGLGSPVFFPHFLLEEQELEFHWPFLGPSPTTGGFSGGCSGREPACQCRRCKRRRFDPWVGRFSWRRDRLPTPVFLGSPGGSDIKASACNAGDLGLIPGLGRSPGEGQSKPLQYSCLENPHGQKSLVGYSPWGHRVRHDSN